MKNQLGKRLRYLWTFELANALIVFPFLYYVIGLRYRLGWFSLAALVEVGAILIVGALFWFLKSRSFSGSPRLAWPGTRGFFRACKIVFGATSVTLLALGVVRACLPDGASTAELALGGALLLLAVLEYVNYYFYQLMYDNAADLRYLRSHRRLKRATMVRELGI